jgi:hypothetical protein
MSTRSDAIRFAMDRIMQATESQEVEHALADDGRFGDLLPSVAAAQSIIRAAEKRLGNRVPADYA